MDSLGLVRDRMSKCNIRIKSTSIKRSISNRRRVTRTDMFPNKMNLILCKWLEVLDNKCNILHSRICITVEQSTVWKLLALQMVSADTLIINSDNSSSNLHTNNKLHTLEPMIATLLWKSMHPQAEKAVFLSEAGMEKFLKKAFMLIERINNISSPLEPWVITFSDNRILILELLHTEACNHLCLWINSMVEEVAKHFRATFPSYLLKTNMEDSRGKLLLKRVTIIETLKAHKVSRGAQRIRPLAKESNQEIIAVLPQKNHLSNFMLLQGERQAFNYFEKTFKKCLL